MDYSAVFDADYYLKNNPDVAKWANNDKDKALQHFIINYGMAEGRRGSEAFDAQSYYNEYPDLRAAYGTDLARYYEHYMSYGSPRGATLPAAQDQGASHLVGRRGLRPRL